MSRLIEVGLAMMDIRDENKALHEDLEDLAVAADAVKLPPNLLTNLLCRNLIRNIETLRKVLARDTVKAILEEHRRQEEKTNGQTPT